MDRKEAQSILNKMKDLIATEFPGYVANFDKTKFDKMGEIDLSFSMVAKSAIDKINQRDTNIGLAKNKIHPEVIGMEFTFEGDNERYMVKSVRTRKQKYPVVAIRKTDGKLFRFSAAMINEYAEREIGTSVQYFGKTAILRGVK